MAENLIGHFAKKSKCNNPDSLPPVIQKKCVNSIKKDRKINSVRQEKKIHNTKNTSLRALIFVNKVKRLQNASKTFVNRSKMRQTRH